jgi:hypothetical protein
LEKEKISADQQEKKIDVSHDHSRTIFDRSRPFYIDGTRVEVEIPFSEDASLFQVQPTTFSFNPPKATFRGHVLLITIEGANLEPQRVKEDIEHRIADIESHLEYLRGSAEHLNGTFLQVAKTQIEQRKEKLLKDKNLVANLGFAIKQREGTPRTYTAPEVKRKIAPIAHKASSAPYMPEPILADREYQHILSIMGQMVRVMQCSPAALHDAGEETLRAHFLMQLNGHYEGQATGETFNYEGKTDILIKSNGRNIFIAECKVWKGAKKHTETIDQLLSYLSWRDTKAAIIIFNRNKQFSNVLQELETGTPQHPNFKKLVSKNSETSNTYLFSHKGDPAREMFITVMAFDVPTKS